ncbi:unnamed protein product [Paramecium sonneborni]|uniref:Tetratricopeptide repeat protein n=1 Tax=Paramecium sonneborni TaxID=65129 RepID=A0A8S1Q987_9CILI|nr:unnamed protein product [Paramecium sonneborni]
MSQQSNQLRSNLEIDSIQKIQSQENHSQLEINTKDQNQIGQEQFKNLQEIESSMNQQIYKNNEFKNYLSSLCDEIYQLIQQFWIIICEQYLQYFNIQQAELSNEELTFPNLKFENKLDEIQDNMKTISDKYIKELKKLIELAQSNKEQIFDIIYSQSLQSCKSLKVDYQNQRNENNERDHQKDGQQQQQTNNNEVEQNIFSNQNSYFINQIQEEINQVNQLIEKAELLQKEGKFKESINYYDNVLKINEKKNIICWRGKGDCLRKLKCFTDAIQCYDKALNIQKNDISSLIGKGECLTMLEKYQESKLVYQEVLKYDDKNLASRFGLGECLRLQGSFKEAIEQYDIALKMDEKNVACIQGKADECFLQILKIDPQNQIAKKEHAELSNEELTFPNLKFENKLDEIQDNMKTISDKYIKELKKLIELAQSNKEQIFDIIYSQSLQSCKSLKVDYQNQRNENNERDHQKDGQQQQQTNNNEVEQNIFSNQNSYFINQIQEEINQVNQLIEKAELLQKEGKFKESINYYDNVLKINEKKNIICWRGKGDCLRKLKCFTDAIQCYDKALNIQKNDISSLIGKGECLTMLEKYQESKLVYQEVLKYDDKNLASRFGLGECLRLQGSFKEAIEQYDIALKMDEKNVACIQGKGYCFQKITKFNKQRKNMRKTKKFFILKIYPIEVIKNVKLGQQKIPHIKQLKQSNTQQEQQIINFNAYKSQSVMPNPIQIHVLTRSESFDNRNVIETINQADDLKKQGKYQDALKLYEKVLEKDPNHIPSLNGKGNCLRLMLRFQDSITFLDRALALNKNSTSLYGKGFFLNIVIGESLRMINYFEEANKCYLESLRMCQEESKNQDPLIYMNLRGLGDILRVKADFEKSIQLYDEALQMNEDHVLSLFGKAESLRGLAKYEESIIFYKRSLSLNQNHLMSLSGLGESLRILKYYQEAQKYHEKALEIDNDRIVNLRGLSECLRHQNNSQKALDYIEKALKINSSDEKCLNSRSFIFIRFVQVLYQKIQKSRKQL